MALLGQQHVSPVSCCARVSARVREEGSVCYCCSALWAVRVRKGHLCCVRPVCCCARVSARVGEERVRILGLPSCCVGVTARVRVDRCELFSPVSCRARVSARVRVGCGSPNSRHAARLCTAPGLL